MSAYDSYRDLDFKYRSLFEDIAHYIFVKDFKEIPERESDFVRRAQDIMEVPINSYNWVQPYVEYIIKTFSLEADSLWYLKNFLNIITQMQEAAYPGKLDFLQMNEIKQVIETHFMLTQRQMSIEAHLSQIEDRISSKENNSINILAIFCAVALTAFSSITLATLSLNFANSFFESMVYLGIFATSCLLSIHMILDKIRIP